MKLIVSLFVGLLAAVPLHAASAEQTIKAIAETWLIDRYHNNNHPDVKFTDDTRNGEPVLRVQFPDKFTQSGVGELIVHLNKTPPSRNYLDFLDEDNLDQDIAQFELTLNGVTFRGRDNTAGKPFREVYLGDLLDPDDRDLIQDRLRLAVNDIKALNPWLRGDTDVHISKPQQELHDFFYDLFKQQLLKFGALGQMPTGMGKTKTIQFFLRTLVQEGTPFRVLWLVNGIDILGQAKNSFDALLVDEMKQESIQLDGATLKSRQTGQEFANGKYQHAFASMDSFTAGSEANRDLLTRWINQEDQAPLIVIMDESHAIGAEGYSELYDWLWNNFPTRIQGRIGLTATPIHYQEGSVTKFYGNRVKYALMEDHEVDQESGLPTLSFLAQVMRAAEKGYLAIPIFYLLSNELSQTDDHQYSDDEISQIIDTLSAFQPFKALLFHQGGKNVDLGSTARAKQFSNAIDDLGAYPGMFNTFVSGEVHNGERSRLYEGFRRSSRAMLSFTQMGSEGLDLPETNLVLLLDESKSHVKIIQRVGRSLRLADGKPFARILDWSGKNIPLMLEVLSLLLFKKQQKGRQEITVRDIIKKILGKEFDANDMAEFYETTAINPDLIRANRFIQEKLLNLTLDYISQRVEFDVKPETEQSNQDHPLPPKITPEESLRSYLERAVLAIASRLDIEANDQEKLWGITTSQAQDAAKGDLTCSDEQFRRSWDNLTFRMRKKLGIASKRKVDFTVVESDKQSNQNHPLPPKTSPKRSLSSYLEGAAPAIARRLGIDPDDQEKHWNITGAQAYDAVKNDLTSLDEGFGKQFGNGWNALTRRMRKELGVTSERKVGFTVVESEKQSSREHPLPPKASTEEGQRFYLERAAPEIARRLGIDPNDKKKLWGITASQAYDAINGDLISLGRGQFENGWNALTLRMRKELGVTSERKVGFTVVESERQSSQNHPLPPKASSKEELPSYLARAAAEIAGRLGIDPNDPVELWNITPSQASDAANGDLTSSDEQFKTSWQTLTSRMRKELGVASEHKRDKVDFTVVASEEQSNQDHPLPPKASAEESLQSYLEQAAPVIAGRLGIDPSDQEKLWSVAASQAHAAINGDLTSSDEQLRGGWKGLAKRKRKQLSVVSESKKEVNFVINTPKLEVRSSPLYDRQLPRIKLLHQAVTRFVTNTLSQHGSKAVFFFIGRDADDFLVTTKRAVKNMNADPEQIKRLLLSRKLLLPYPANNRVISRLSESDLTDILAEQGLTADLFTIQEKQVYLIDIGFDGHVMRPVLASLLKNSGLDVKPFFELVHPSFLLSKPDARSLFPKVNDYPQLLEYLDERDFLLHKKIRSQQIEFSQQYATDKDAALVKYLAAYGSLLIGEIPLGAMFQELIDAGQLTEEQLQEVWQSTSGPRSMLQSPEEFRDWLESFVEGKGLHVVRSETEEQHNNLRHVLSRSTGRLADITAGSSSGKFEYRYEGQHPKEAAIDPEAERQRQALICGSIFGS